VVPARQTPLGSQHPLQVAALHDDCARHVPSTQAWLDGHATQSNPPAPQVPATVPA
jgi:hypothetical protein